MTTFPVPLTSLGMVWLVLRTNGPMTAIQISQETGIIPKKVREVIFDARAKNVWDMRFRKVGTIREGRSTHSFIYELNNAPDAKSIPSMSKKKFDDMAQERADKKRIARLAKETKPFRHWQETALFGPAGRAS